MLDAEDEEFCGAKRYERTESRQDTWAGHYVIPGWKLNLYPVGSDPPWLRELTWVFSNFLSMLFIPNQS